jgi:hypothetical protein
LIITERNQLSKLVTQLRKELRDNLPNTVNCKVAVKWGFIDVPVRFSNEIQLWVGYDPAIDEANKRYWTAFGLGIPHEGQSLSNVIQINFPFEGLNRSISGVFIETPSGILVGHRGRLGGGRAGIGKRLFWEHFSGRVFTSRDGENFAIIAQLGSPDLISNMYLFILEANRIKKQR